MRADTISQDDEIKELEIALEMACRKIARQVAKHYNQIDDLTYDLITACRANAKLRIKNKEF